MYALWFIEDENNESHVREVITIWDLLSEFGGMLEIVVIGMSFFVASF
jgi:hypothetical protein